MYFQDLILTLQGYWAKQGCVLQQPYDLEKGAGTSHPATFLRALGPEPWRAAYVEPSRRPSDGRYGENPNRLGHYYQFQVILKPSPLHVQELYLDSLRHIGVDPLEHDIRFVEDDWENPTLGAWGLGWEVWSDGMEVTQFTYFQQCGGLDLPLVSAELTYGLERLCMYLQNVNNVYDLVWAKHPDGTLVKYGDVHHQSEVEFSRYHFEASDAALLFRLFDSFEADAARLLDIGDQDPKRSLVLPAYDLCLKCSHTFNQLNARGAISVTERQRYIKRVRDLAKRCAESYLRARYLLGFPLLKDEAARTTAKADFEKSELGARLLDPARRVG